MIKESYISKIFKIGTAGFIKEDGTFLYADESEDFIHGGFEEEILDKNYPEFSNTHPEEDTCVRLFKEPNEIQYKKLEEVIDTYLDFEQYCKIEVWNNGKYNFYKVYSLVENACEDNSWEEQIGNWTGYKLVQIIKNYFNNKLDEKIVHLDNGKWQVQSEKGRNMGTYDTKAEAEKRLGQVEYFKHLNESVGKGSITDETIKGYFYDCVNEMYKLNFFEGDFILHYELLKLEWGDSLHTFGTYHWPEDGKGEGSIVLNKYMFDEPEEAIKNTIYHELCHYVVFKWGLKLGIYKNVGWNHWVEGKEVLKYPSSYWTSHGQVWKSVAAKVGRATNQIIRTTDSFTKHTGVGAHAEESYKYILKCKHCGNEFKYSKRTEFVDSVINGRGHTDRFWCRCRDGNKGHDFEIVRGR